MDRDLFIKYRTLGVLVVTLILSLLMFHSFYAQKEKKEISLRLRVFFSEMIQVVQSSVYELGSPSEWGITNEYNYQENLDNLIISKLRTEKKCIDKSENCLFNGNYRNLNSKIIYKDFNELPSAILYNGVSMAIEPQDNCSTNKDICAIVYADMNGEEKPNQFGKDLFVFMIFNTDSIAFMPYNLSDNPSIFSNHELYGCNKNAKEPMYCSSLLFLNNWQFSSNYPW